MQQERWDRPARTAPIARAVLFMTAIAAACGWGARATAEDEAPNSALAARDPWRKTALYAPPLRMPDVGTGIASSSDGSVLVGWAPFFFCIIQDGQIRTTTSIFPHEACPSWAAVSSDGRRVAACQGRERSVAVVDIATMETVAMGTTPAGAVPERIHLSEDGSRLLVACEDGSVYLSRLRQNPLAFVRARAPHADRKLLDAGFSADGRTIALVERGFDGVSVVQERATWMTTEIAIRNARSVSVVSEDEIGLVCGLSTGEVVRVDLNDGTRTRVAHVQGSVVGVSTSPGTRRVAVVTDAAAHAVGGAAYVVGGDVPAREVARDGVFRMLLASGGADLYVKGYSPVVHKVAVASLGDAAPDLRVPGPARRIVWRGDDAVVVGRDGGIWTFAAGDRQGAFEAGQLVCVPAERDADKGVSFRDAVWTDRGWLASWRTLVDGDLLTVGMGDDQRTLAEHLSGSNLDPRDRVLSTSMGVTRVLVGLSDATVVSVRPADGEMQARTGEPMSSPMIRAATSPDGGRVVVCTQEGEVWYSSARGSPLARVGSVSVDWAMAVALLSDSETAVVLDLGGVVHWIDLARSESIRRWETGMRVVYDASVNATGTTWFAASDGGVYRLETDEQKRTKVLSIDVGTVNCLSAPSATDAMIVQDTSGAIWRLDPPR